MKKLQSMTGFSSVAKGDDDLLFTCEMRSVNGKSLDVRLRLPSGFENQETQIKKRIGQFVERGNIQVSIDVEHSGVTSKLSIDEDRFSALAKEASRLAKKHGLVPPTSDGLLSIRGVVLSDDTKGVDFTDDAAKEIADKLLFAVIDEAGDALATMRQIEGASLHQILTKQLATIDELVSAARNDQANQPVAIMARLVAQVDLLLDAKGREKLDQDRLHTEVALLSTKADIREEIDRLDGHVKAARDLLSEGGAIGRKLDFLSQEFNRETNTICSKSASATLTATGLALKAVIDQFREQVQNLQ